MDMYTAAAFGRALMACYRGEAQVYHIERDDNYLEAGDLRQYFLGEKGFSPLEQTAMDLVRGRVLDIGCGAGKHSVYLQEQGYDVLGIDISSLALQVCELRGLKKTKLLSISEIGQLPADSVDTVIMMGNNFGLFGSFANAREYLKELLRITSAEGQIVAVTSDPYITTDPIHLAYHKFNLSRGRMAGQIRFRIRFQNLVNDWMDYLLASPAEVRAILEGTGWKLGQALPSSSGERFYLSVIVKS